MSLEKLEEQHRRLTNQRNSLIHRLNDYEGFEREMIEEEIIDLEREILEIEEEIESLDDPNW